MKNVNLPDLLLLFIYLEVFGMVTSYWRSLTIRLTYPLFIAITANIVTGKQIGRAHV